MILVRSAVVLGGRFRVFEDGSVNKIFLDYETPAKQYPTGRRNKYLAVCYTENGKEKHAYVHRLIASAFIPNPEKLPQVNHIDGNTRNNAAKNLEWCTAQRNVQHAYETGLIIPNIDCEPCRVCGVPTRAESGVCPKCKSAIEVEENKIRVIAKRQERYKAVNLGVCTEKEKEYVTMAASGASIPEIARFFGVSSQCVSAALVNAEKKSAFGVKIPSYVKDERVRLANKVEKANKKYTSLLEKTEEAKQLYDLALKAQERHEKMIMETYGSANMEW